MSGDRPILVVDDQFGVRRLVQEIFVGTGYPVVTAANGREALEIAAAKSPILVLLDMKMPIMDGLETLRQLKAADPDIIVMMMTAVGEQDRVQEALNSGAQTCIAKPFDVFALRDRVLSVLKEGQA